MTTSDAGRLGLPAFPTVVGAHALGFLDPAVLWTLRYVLFLGAYGRPARRAGGA